MHLKKKGKNKNKKRSRLGSTTTIKNKKHNINNNNIKKKTHNNNKISTDPILLNLKIRILDLFKAQRSILMDTTQLNHDITQNKIGFKMKMTLHTTTSTTNKQTNLCIGMLRPQKI